MSKIAINQNSIVIATVLLIALASGFYFTSTISKNRDALNRLGTWLPEPKLITAFELKDHQGKKFSQQHLANNERWTLMLLGYSYCPDICSPAMAALSRIYQLLSESQSQQNLPQLVFLSIDPERDTQQRLTDFLHQFNAPIVGVTGNHQQLLNITAQLYLSFFKTPVQALKGHQHHDEYLLAHNQVLLVIDAAGRYRGFFHVPLNPEKVAQAFSLFSF